MHTFGCYLNPHQPSNVSSLDPSIHIIYLSIQPPFNSFSSHCFHPSSIPSLRPLPPSFSPSVPPFFLTLPLQFLHPFFLPSISPSTPFLHPFFLPSFFLLVSPSSILLFVTASLHPLPPPC